MVILLTGAADAALELTILRSEICILQAAICQINREACSKALLLIQAFVISLAHAWKNGGFSVDNGRLLCLNNAAGWNDLAPGGVPGSHN